ncbi:MAG: hypothetical protein I3273_02715 [Candidatus Moeniiplasma glomeromycotorum]|nr:hypothetical protein [Candidatus Moeniiplasma glomeromycotorum]MCE8167632.1 hypothetical protein [Candidatus Moeniiplasma glomeromycotorum]MCE8169017.1 hypothetical protein [Candidatus Moeniiplasma glomeromycotorum]
MNENEESRKIPTFINIKNFRNLKDLKFEFFEGKVNIILGKNNVGKSNLLDYINSWYIKNDKNSNHEIFYLKDGENFTKHLSSPMVFEVKKVLLISTKENKAKDLILRSIECNEHHYFEIEGFIFGIKQNIILTKCCLSSLICSLKDYKELRWNEKKLDRFEPQKLLIEIEEVIRESILFLFDKVLKDFEEEFSPQRFYGLGEPLTIIAKGDGGRFYFEFKFSFLDPWDGKRKSIGLGAEKIIFLEFLLDNLQTKRQLILDIKNDRSWRYKNWIFFFLPAPEKKITILFDKPESFLHPTYEKKFFYSLKKLTENRDNCNVIITTNSTECLSSFPSEIYDGNFHVSILDWRSKVVYLKKIIDKIKDSIIETYAEYGCLFEEELKNPDTFYRDKWIEILSKEYTSKIFFSKRILFVEGSTELVFFSLVLSPTLKQLNKQFTDYLVKLDERIKEQEKLSAEQKEKDSEDKVIPVAAFKAWREEFISHYVNFTNEDIFWKKVSKINVVPIFGKFNYIFFAKVSESLFLEHKFILDEDKENLDEKEITDWGKFYDANSPEGKERQLNEKTTKII